MAGGSRVIRIQREDRKNDVKLGRKGWLVYLFY